MLNPVQIAITDKNGEKRFIIIEPVLHNSDGKLTSTGCFKIFKDAFGEESALFTEPLEINETSPNLPDKLNPDYLGLFTIKDDGTWNFEGELLSPHEQTQVIEVIQKP